jgi:hypothetical protein
MPQHPDSAVMRGPDAPNENDHVDYDGARMNFTTSAHKTSC